MKFTPKTLCTNTPSLFTQLCKCIVACMHMKLHKHFSIQQWGMLQLILSLHTQIYISLLWGPVFTYVSELINDHSETNVLHLGVLHRKPCCAPSFSMCIKSKSMLYTFMQCVLNRKACYTPVVPKCIKSKNMLYVNKPMCIKSKSMLYTFTAKVY